MANGTYALSTPTQSEVVVLITEFWYTFRASLNNREKNKRAALGGYWVSKSQSSCTGEFVAVSMTTTDLFIVNGSGYANGMVGSDVYA